MSQLPPEPKWYKLCEGAIIGATLGFLVSFVVLLFIRPPRYPVGLPLIGGGILLGAVAGLLWFYLPERRQSSLATGLVWIILSPIIAYSFIIPYMILWAIIHFIAEISVSFFELGPLAQPITDWITFIVVGFFVITAIIDFLFGSKVKAGPDFYPVDLGDVDAELGVGVNGEWRKLRAKLRPGDQIWRWSSPAWTWHMLCGRCGYMIVRRGRSTRYRITTGMN